MTPDVFLPKRITDSIQFDKYGVCVLGSASDQKARMMELDQVHKDFKKKDYCEGLNFKEVVERYSASIENYVRKKTANENETSGPALNFQVVQTYDRGLVIHFLQAKSYNTSKQHVSGKRGPRKTQ